TEITYRYLCSYLSYLNAIFYLVHSNGSLSCPQMIEITNFPWIKDYTDENDLKFHASQHFVCTFVHRIRIRRYNYSGTQLKVCLFCTCETVGLNKLLAGSDKLIPVNRLFHANVSGPLSEYKIKSSKIAISICNGNLIRVITRLMKVIKKEKETRSCKKKRDRRHRDLRLQNSLPSPLDIEQFLSN
ncbi:hypothetical protein L9F63_000098, partial [Diploptera punctata]